MNFADTKILYCLAITSQHVSLQLDSTRQIKLMDVRVGEQFLSNLNSNFSSETFLVNDPLWFSLLRELLLSCHPVMAACEDALGGDGTDVSTISATHQGKRKCKRGSLADLISKSHLPPGPANFEELMNYPVDLVDDAFKSNERKQRCMSLLREGLIEHSDYSGISAEREAKRLLFQVLHEEYGLSVPHHFIKSCDIDPDCQAVLVHASDTLDEQRSCVFKDIREQIHPVAQAFCEEVLASADPDSIDLLEAAYKKIFQYLLATENGAFAVNEDCMLKVLL